MGAKILSYIKPLGITAHEDCKPQLFEIQKFENFVLSYQQKIVVDLAIKITLNISLRLEKVSLYISNKIYASSLDYEKAR